MGNRILSRAKRHISGSDKSVFRINDTRQRSPGISSISGVRTFRRSVRRFLPQPNDHSDILQTQAAATGQKLPGVQPRRLRLLPVVYPALHPLPVSAVPALGGCREGMPGLHVQLPAFRNGRAQFHGGYSI